MCEICAVIEGLDAPSTTSTPAALTDGDYFFGTLDSNADSDWIEVTLNAGETYSFGLAGTGALSDRLNDPLLRLRDANGDLITSDDDGGPGRSSALTYTATSTGTYYLDVQSYGNGSDGAYGLSMATGDRVTYDVSMGAGNLVRSNTSWGSQPGQSVDVTWGFRASGTEPSGGNAFVRLSDAQIAATSTIMDYVGGVSGVNFVQVSEGGFTNNATILFGSYAANDGSGAYAYFPGSTSNTSNAGDVWLNNNAGSTTSLNIGSYSYFTILHEIGHALGLSHPGDYNAGQGGSITYSNNAQFVEDSHQFSIMSYFDERQTTTSVGGYPDTLMLFDLQALHSLYGADYSFHAGDTVYGFNATVGGAYDFTSNTNPLLSIWDGSGSDTIDLSGYSMGQVLNLNDGEFSDIGGYDGNVSIAVGAVIENGIGGSGNDELIGNEFANRLTGGAGNDTLNGGAGDDILDGGVGADDLRGGDDIDHAIYNDSDAAVTIDLAAGTGSGGHAQGDTLTGIERVTGSNGFGDTLSGDSGDNLLRGNGGNDTLSGGDGADMLFGGSGNDWAIYTTSDAGVTVNLARGTGSGGHAQGDTLNDIERVSGSDGFGDALYGDAGANILRGNGGDDVLGGQAGADSLFGGSGIDHAVYNGSDAAVFIDLASGTGSGGDAQGDTLNDIERVTGSNRFGDRLFGDDGDNLLRGNGGNDTLRGEDGADMLVGGSGSDWAVYRTSDAGVTIDMAAGTGTGGHAQGDTLFGIEKVSGSLDHGDTLLGNGGRNTLNGNGGNDTLNGREGDDLLVGGSGNDTFIFEANWGDDIISDFNVSDGDVLDFSAFGISQGDLAISYGANETTISFAGNTVELEGSTSILQADEFIF